MELLTNYEKEEFFNGTDASVALGSYIAWFLTATDIYGYVTECDDSTYEVVGVHFIVDYQVDGSTGTAASLYGEASGDTVAQLNYAYDYSSTDGKEINYDILVTIHFEVTDNLPESDLNISILEPLPGSTVEGLETISTYITAGSDTAEITGVEFYVDVSLLGTVTQPPFEWIWDTDTYTDGEYTLRATVDNSEGESAESEEVVVTIGEVKDVAAAPVFGPPEGEVSAGTEVTISTTTTGADIYYTTDETAPTDETGTLYTNPITITEATTIKAIACKTGWTDSSVVSAEYTIEETGPGIGLWSYTASFANARSCHTSVVHNGYIYVLGGYYYDGVDFYFYNDVQYAAFVP